MNRQRAYEWAAICFASLTMLAAVGLVATGGWLISAAALMPPILTLQVAIVSVRAFGISRAVFRWLERVTSHEVALAGTTANRVRLWEAAAILGPRGVWRLRGSDALDRLTADTDALQDRVTRVRTPFAAALISSLLLVIVQTSFQPLAGLALLVSMLLAGVVFPLATVRVETSVSKRALQARDRVSATISDVVNRGAEFRVLGLTQLTQQKLANQDAERIEIELQASQWQALSGSLNGVAAGLAVFSSLIVGVVAHANNNLDGVMIAVLALLPWSAGEVSGTFAQAVSARTRVVAAEGRVNELLDAADQRVAKATAPRQQILASPSVLEVDRVSVTWTDRPAVIDVSLSVRRGERLAIVGPTGCGKSTVAAAILRLVEHEGTITLDSVPTERLVDFRSHVSALLQVTHIFHASVAENLRLAAPMATEQELQRALQKAGLENWVRALPAGLETILGDGGRGLSGGERQRLGIARVLLSDAAFVVLDEPTEHLDAATAAKVWQTINRSFTDRGLLIISHDPEVALDCDQVMVMSGGRVVEHGAPDDLDPHGWFHRTAATDL